MLYSPIKHANINLIRHGLRRATFPSQGKALGETVYDKLCALHKLSRQPRTQSLPLRGEGAEWNEADEVSIARVSPDHKPCFIPPMEGS